jgi:hypothetical protein
VPVVIANGVKLTSGTGIGSGNNIFTFELTGGTFEALSAAGDVRVRSLGISDLAVKTVVAGSGDVTLEALSSIIDGNAPAPSNLSPAPNISAHGLTLRSLLGGIGTVGKDLRIAVTGLLTVDSQHDVRLSQLVGDLNIFSIGVAALGETAFIASAGAILNGNTGVGPAGSNVSAGRTRLFAVGNIGSATKALVSTVGYLAGTSTTGGVWIDNYGALTIGSIGDAQGIVAAGSGQITAHSPIDITQNVTFGGNLSYSTAASVSPLVADIITVHAGVTVQAGGNLSFTAYDGVVVQAGAALIAGLDDKNAQQANRNVSITLLADGSKAVPGSVILAGSVTASGSITVQTSDQPDSVSVTGALDAQGRIVIATGGGADRVSLTGSITARTGLTVDGGAGNNSITVHPRLLVGDISVFHFTGNDHALVDGRVLLTRPSEALGGSVVSRLTSGHGQLDLLRRSALALSNTLNPDDLVTNTATLGVLPPPSPAVTEGGASGVDGYFSFGTGGLLNLLLNNRSGFTYELQNEGGGAPFPGSFPDNSAREQAFTAAQAEPDAEASLLAMAELGDLRRVELAASAAAERDAKAALPSLAAELPEGSPALALAGMLAWRAVQRDIEPKPKGLLDGLFGRSHAGRFRRWGGDTHV